MARKDDLQLVTATILSATATGAGSWIKNGGSGATSFHAVVTGTGSVSATVAIEVSNDGVNACVTPLGTITLTGTSTGSDGFASLTPWAWYRANATALGAGDTITVTAGK